MPQWIFVSGVIALAIYVLQDSLKFNSLTGMYPLVASVSTLVFLTPVVLMMVFKHAPSDFFYDAELKSVADRGRSAEF